MPELPEVEVVKKSLKKEVSNLTVKKVSINNKNLRYKIKESDLNNLRNKKILSITRRSKYLLLHFNNNYILLVHLGMTGKFYISTKIKKLKKMSFYYNNSDHNTKHDHLVFHFNDQKKLIYNDVRRFGFVKVFKSSLINENDHFKKLGPEPLSKNFNYDYFKNKIKKRDLPVKSLLMSQSFISGLGNIYVSEILYKSKVGPQRKSSSLGQKEIVALIKNTKKILKKSILFGGSSIKDFKDVSGSKGKFQQKFYVYGREGLECRRKDCKKKIIKTNISNRSTFYCSSCQN
jgi:formamidopyrimidine-DNA glycosylase